MTPRRITDLPLSRGDRTLYISSLRQRRRGCRRLQRLVGRPDIRSALSTPGYAEPFDSLVVSQDGEIDGRGHRNSCNGPRQCFTPTASRMEKDVNENT